MNILVEEAQVFNEFVKMLNRYAQFYNRTVVPDGLEVSPSEYQILKLISDNEGISIGEISHEIGISQPAVSKSVKKLINKEFIVSKINEQNKKYRNLYLTELAQMPLDNYLSNMHKVLFEQIYPTYNKFNDEGREDFCKIIRDVSDFLANLNANNLSL